MSQKLLVTLFSLFLSCALIGQGVGINNPTPDASALLDLTSTGKGLLVPRMTTVQRDAIPLPATSLLVYNTTSASFEYFNGAVWVPIASPGWSLTGNTGTNPTTNFIGTTNAQPLAFRTNGIERMRIGAGATTQVGINTTTPGSTLHVLFTLPNNIGSAVQVETNQGTSNTNIGFRNSITNSFASLGMQPNGDFGLGLSCNFGGCGFGTEAFRVKANGNFGIGTANATERLHVVGNIRMVDGNQAAGRVMMSDALGSGSWQVPKQPDYYAALGTFATIIGPVMNPLSQMLINFTPKHPIAIVHFSGGTPNSTVNCNTSVEFQLVVNGSAVHTFPTGITGEGGLGTDILGYDASFTYPISVTPGLPTTVEIRARSTNCAVPNAAGRSLIVIDPNGTGFTTTTGTPPSSGAWDVIGNATTNPNVNFLGTTDNQALAFRTLNVERMRISNTGNLGIGTAAPTERLEVVGSVLTNGDGEGVVVDAGGSKRVGLMKYGGIEGALVHGNTVPLRFGQVDQADVTGGTFTEQVRIDNNGNVGIGIPIPATKLHVNGAIATLPFVLSATTSPFVFPPGDRTYIRFGSTSTPVNRTVIFANGLTPGQLLIVECIAPGGLNGIRFTDQGNMNVSGIRDLTIDDTITFIWNGTKWVEVAFADN